jgi:filamentous hemagglutinin
LCFCKSLDTLIKKQIKVDDLQFLIGKDGSIVINDPLDVFLNQSPSKVNLDTIDYLIEVAKKNI